MAGMSMGKICCGFESKTNLNQIKDNPIECQIRSTWRYVPRDVICIDAIGMLVEMCQFHSFLAGKKASIVVAMGKSMWGP